MIAALMWLLGFVVYIGIGCGVADVYDPEPSGCGTIVLWPILAVSKATVWAIRKIGGRR